MYRPRLTTQISVTYHFTASPHLPHSPDAVSRYMIDSAERFGEIGLDVTMYARSGARQLFDRHGHPAWEDRPLLEGGEQLSGLYTCKIKLRCTKSSSSPSQWSRRVWKQDQPGVEWKQGCVGKNDVLQSVAAYRNTESTHSMGQNNPLTFG